MLSVITPSHNPKYLDQTKKSLELQTFKDFEWVVVPNNGAKVEYTEPWIRIIPYTESTNSIGQIKQFAFSQGKGEILVELDHDDLLMPEALQKIHDAFQDPNICFVHSGSAEFNDDGTERQKFDPAYGWQFTQLKDNPFSLKQPLWNAVPFEITPASLSWIYYAPNHVRAFRRKCYEEVGKHDATLGICDDQDLIARFAINNHTFKTLSDCLYLYRVHGNNEWLQRNALIQAKTAELRDKYAEQLWLSWTKRQGLEAIDLCGGISKPIGYKSIDKFNGDIIADLDCLWPLKDNSVGVIRAWDAIEHLKSPMQTMSEAHRVLTHGGLFTINVPSTDGRGAFCDPTHVSFWNELSFRYWTDKNFAIYLWNNTVKFQVQKLLTWFPNEYCKTNNIPYVRADLVAIKSGPRIPGLINW